jgi:glycosyltransferase involved in cell wall biosynthesis
MNSSNRVTVVIPLLNEEKSLPAFLLRLEKVAIQLRKSRPLKILFVVDPSTDKTVDILMEFKKRFSNVSIICTKKRLGHQHSIILGMKMVEFGSCITMDGDGQHPPEIIPKMLERLRKPDEIIQTVRSIKFSRGSVWASIFSMIFYRVFQKISHLKNIKEMSDFRLLGPEPLKTLNNMFQGENFFLRGYIQTIGAKIKYVEYEFIPRVSGKTKYSTKAKIDLAISGLTSFSRFPLNLTLFVGLCIIVVAFGAVLYLVIMDFFGSAYPKGWLTIVAVVVFLHGIQMLSLGMLGIYILSINEKLLPKDKNLIIKII